MKSRTLTLTFATVALSLPLAGSAGTAGAATAPASNPTQTCPIIGSVDPDFVTLIGPATIPADGMVHSVTLLASEAEVDPNLVSLTAITTTGTKSSPLTSPIILATSAGLHQTTVSVPLAGVAGRTYTINWVATFDFGPHVCASVLPGHQAFTVGVG
jgi:hypothetical protein